MFGIGIAVGCGGGVMIAQHYQKEQDAKHAKVCEVLAGEGFRAHPTIDKHGVRLCVMVSERVGISIIPPAKEPAK